jgi:hypothetical protein
MDGAAGESEQSDIRVEFDRHLKLEFHGSRATSDAGLLAFRELDDALGLTEWGSVLADSRTGKNGRHSLIAQFQQAVFGRLAERRRSPWLRPRHALDRRRAGCCK